jgi:carboxyl-terminal processing protease
MKGLKMKNGAATLTIALVAVLLLPATEVCLSFQPKISPTTSLTSSSSSSALFSRDRRNTNALLSNDDDNNEKSLIDKITHQAATIATASVISFSFGTMMMTPTSPAFAADTVAAASDVAPQQSLLLQEVSSADVLIQQQRETSVVEEVWNLIDKYYIDRSFNKLNWNTVRNDVLAKAEKSNFDNDKSMKIIYDMVGSLNDKYTRVLDIDQYAAIQKYDLIGVGVTLMPNSQKDIIVGAPPIAKSAGDLAGLKVGDYVTAVNGIPTRGNTAFDIIDQISENSNAKTITFSIMRGDDNTNKFDVTMNRQTMEVKDPVQYKITEERPDGTKVGYLRVSEFNTLVNSSLKNAMLELKKQGANAYVMDLRGNGGGAFQSAVEISSLFLRDRVATYVVDSNQVELPFRTSKLQDLVIEPEVPLVIWLDGGSASASEVLAGSLHDNCRAVTMGDQSFGKGLIQAVYGLKNGAGLVVTVARYVTPSGYEIQGKGITPDILPLGKNMPAPVFVPILSTDTSKVDFHDIEERLNSKFCHVPEDRVNAKTATRTTN